MKRRNERVRRRRGGSERLRDKRRAESGGGNCIRVEPRRPNVLVVAESDRAFAKQTWDPILEIVSCMSYTQLFYDMITHARTKACQESGPVSCAIMNKISG